MCSRGNSKRPASGVFITRRSVEILHADRYVSPAPSFRSLFTSEKTLNLMGYSHRICILRFYVMVNSQPNEPRNLLGPTSQRQDEIAGLVPPKFHEKEDPELFDSTVGALTRPGGLLTISSITASNQTVILACVTMMAVWIKRFTLLCTGTSPAESVLGWVTTSSRNVALPGTMVAIDFFIIACSTSRAPSTQPLTPHMGPANRAPTPCHIKGIPTTVLGTHRSVLAHETSSGQLRGELYHT